MASVRPLTGFPEWSPEERAVELIVLDRVRAIFESFGYVSIETRSVEPLDVLLKKGDTDKEIYVVKRLHAAADDDSTLGLHYDLTVPLSRYVVQNRGQLCFPFKRYQIQKSWRGERPQAGRYREFYQADADVIAEGSLPLHFDAEMAALAYEAVSALPVPPVTILINNRKVLEGFYRSLGVEDVAPVLRVVDKLDKIGAAEVAQGLVALGLSTEDAARCLALGEIRGSGEDVVRRVRELNGRHPLLEEGLDELFFVLRSLSSLPEQAVVADLRIARGFDYYTGTVYEGVLRDAPESGTVCSGGRYDELASVGKLKLPGVGISLGISRLLGRLFDQKRVGATRKVPTCVLVTLPDEAQRPACHGLARQLRARGIATEVFHAPARFGKQIDYAATRGVPFVWFPSFEAGVPHRVKDIRSGEQVDADPESWAPPEADRYIRIRQD